MNDKFKELTIGLSRTLVTCSNDFLVDRLDDEENIENIMNLIISGHISSLCTLLMDLSDKLQDEKLTKNTEQFIKYLHECLCNAPGTRRVVPFGGTQSRLNLREVNNDKLD